MYNINICLAVVLLVGCGTMPSTDVDAGVVPDSSVPDAGTEARDAATSADADARTDAAVDAGRPDASPDAGTPSDAGTDSSVPELDSGTPTPDAGADAGMMDAGPGVPVDIGVSGDGSCLLTDNNEMWCWGYGISTPTYVADAVALEGTCAIALDGHVLCWNGAGVTDHAGTDAAVVGVQSYLGRVDGLVRTIGLATSPTWSPSGLIAAMPALNCAILTDGTMTCWDRVVTTPPNSEYRNFWDAVSGTATYDIVDVGRRGTFNSGDFVACYAWTGMRPRAGGGFDSGPGIMCSAASHALAPSRFAGGTEVDMAWGRTCVVSPTSTAGHPAGVYCTTDRPEFELAGSDLLPLPATDMYFQEYTDVVGTDLALGANHACIMQGSNVLCWGDNRRGQLGDGTSVSSRIPESIVW